MVYHQSHCLQLSPPLAAYVQYVPKRGDLSYLLCGEAGTSEQEEELSRFPIVLQTLCMLDTAGKVSEKLLKLRLQHTIWTPQDL